MSVNLQKQKPSTLRHGKKAHLKSVLSWGTLDKLNAHVTGVPAGVNGTKAIAQKSLNGRKTMYPTAKKLNSSPAQ
jgi:hypothetical protein